MPLTYSLDPQAARARQAAAAGEPEEPAQAGGVQIDEWILQVRVAAAVPLDTQLRLRCTAGWTGCFLEGLGFTASCNEPSFGALRALGAAGCACSRVSVLALSSPLPAVCGAAEGALRHRPRQAARVPGGMYRTTSCCWARVWLQVACAVAAQLKL